MYVPLEIRCISEELEVDGVGLKRCLGFLDFGKEFFEMETGPDTITDLESSSGSARKFEVLYLILGYILIHNIYCKILCITFRVLENIQNLDRGYIQAKN